MALAAAIACLSDPRVFKVDASVLKVIAIDRIEVLVRSKRANDPGKRQGCMEDDEIGLDIVLQEIDPFLRRSEPSLANLIRQDRQGPQSLKLPGWLYLEPGLAS